MKMRTIIAAFAALLAVSGYAYSQGQQILTSLTGTEIVGITSNTVSAGASVRTLRGAAGQYAVNTASDASLTVANGIQHFLLDTGTAATVTVNLPAAPQDGDIVVVSCDVAIGTSLTIAATQTIKAGPSAAACTAGTSYGFLYRASNTTYYRVQ